MRRLSLIFLIAACVISASTYAQNEEGSQRLKELTDKIQEYGDLATGAAKSNEIQLDEFRANIRDLLDQLKAIYGPDDRRNYFESSVSGNERQAADATAMLVYRSELIPDNSGATYSLPSEGAGLCDAERFSTEPAPGFCSAFAVGRDLVATAGHCINTQPKCDQVAFVFGFRMDSADARPEAKISAENVYMCKTVVDSALGGGDQSDWSVVRVNRPISAPITNIRGSKMAKIEKGASLTVVGYPIGLPVKIANNASVRELKNTFFVANLDTYGGNSGSAVFNSDALAQGHLLVEGILVRGEQDFIQSSPCRISKRCPNTGCRGESVTYASEIEGALGE